MMEMKKKELYEAELKEQQELNEWLAQYRKKPHGKSAAFGTNDLGGHMELKKQDTVKLLSPSQEEVNEMLKDYGRKLGFDYVAR